MSEEAGDILGLIRLSPLHFVPENYAACNGAVLSILRNQALFSVLGTRFGGDGRTTFALPKIPSPAANCVYIICTSGAYPTKP